MEDLKNNKKKRAENCCQKWRCVTLLKQLTLQNNPKAEGHRPQGLSDSPVIAQLPAEVSLHSHHTAIKPFTRVHFSFLMATLPFMATSDEPRDMISEKDDSN